jgi:hypothetical protein
MKSKKTSLPTQPADFGRRQALRAEGAVARPKRRWRCPVQGLYPSRSALAAITHRKVTLTLRTPHTHADTPCHTTPRPSTRAIASTTTRAYPPRTRTDNPTKPRHPVVVYLTAVVRRPRTVPHPAQILNSGNGSARSIPIVLARSQYRSCSRHL